MSGNGTRAERPAFDALKRRVGGTPLLPAKVLGRQLKVPNLFLKDEGANPSGSILDRPSLAHVEDAMRRGRSTVVTAAQDPRGVSLALLAGAAGLESVVYVPERAAERWAVEARAAGAKIVRTPGTLVDATTQASRDAQENGWHDATCVGDTATERIEAYAGIADELGKDLPSGRAVVAVPTREGTAITGIWSGFERLRRLPQLVAATSKMGNPIVWSLAQGADDCTDLEPNQIFPSSVSEPLATYKAAHGTSAVKAVRASGGWGYAASDSELESMAKQLERTESVAALPAAVAGIAALHFAAKFGRLEPDVTCVAILTSRH